MARGVVHALALSLVLVALPGAPVGASVPPANDDIANATVIGALPFTDQQDTTEATGDPSDPLCGATPIHTIWYRFTAPGDMKIQIEASGDRFVSAWTGAPGSLSGGGCGFRSTSFDAFGGTTYYLMVSGPPGDVEVAVSRIPTPSGLEMHASKTKVTFGKSFTLRGQLVAFGDPTNTTVDVFAMPFGEPESLVATPSLDASGKWSVSQRPTKRTAYRAEWSGDEFHLPSESSVVTVEVIALLEGKMIRFDGKAGRYRLYDFTSTCPSSGRGCPAYSTKLTPAHQGKRLSFTLQVHVGRWRTVGTFRIRLPASSRIIVVLVYAGPQVIGIASRIRSAFGGDADHLADTAPWSYFKVTGRSGSSPAAPTRLSQALTGPAGSALVEYVAFRADRPRQQRR